jgi:hypothetical protein
MVSLVMQPSLSSGDDGHPVLRINAVLEMLVLFGY